MEPHPLNSERALNSLAGDKTFRRGRDYFERRLVREVEIIGPRASATVVGTLDYNVRIQIVDHARSLNHHCSCPVGARGMFCKHCVAVVLRWREIVEAAGDGVSDGETVIPLNLVHVESPAREPQHSAALANRPDVPPTTTVDLGELRGRLTAAFRISGGFVEYRQMPKFTAGLDDAIDLLEDYLSRETATQTIKLCEQNLRRVERTFERVDDSRGDMRLIQFRLCLLHLQAVLVAQPDGVELAERLFEWEMESEWEIFLDAYDTYGRAFGEAGRQRYRELATQAWRLEESENHEDAPADSIVRLFQLRRLVRRLAVESGDPEQIVDAYRDQLTSQYGYLDLVRDLERVGRHDLAWHWANIGVERFPEGNHLDLYEYLATRAAADGNSDEAVELAMAAFMAGPSVERFAELHAFGTVARRWPQVREQALARLESDATSSGAQAMRARHTLIDSLVWDRAIDQALEAAQRHGAHVNQWLNMAAACESDRPLTAAEIYFSQVDELLQPPNRNYRRVADLLAHCKDLMLAADDPAGFETAIAQVREAHGRKTSFMPLIAGL